MNVLCLTLLLRPQYKHCRVAQTRVHHRNVYRCKRAGARLAWNTRAYDANAEEYIGAKYTWCPHQNASIAICPKVMPSMEGSWWSSARDALKRHFLCAATTAPLWCISMGTQGLRWNSNVRHGREKLYNLTFVSRVLLRLEVESGTKRDSDTKKIRRNEKRGIMRWCWKWCLMSNIIVICNYIGIRWIGASDFDFKRPLTTLADLWCLKSNCITYRQLAVWVNKTTRSLRKRLYCVWSGMCDKFASFPSNVQSQQC